MNKSQAKAIGAVAMTVAVPGALLALAGYAAYRLVRKVTAELPSAKVKSLERIAYERPPETA